jgi:predicted transcriptional regulator
VALTLKVDEKTYVRLRTLGAKQRRTNQDILDEALQEHLKRLGA